MNNNYYKKEKNLFQSQAWLNFQKSYGRLVVDLKEAKGIVLDLPLGKKAVWIQKSPDKITNFKSLISDLPKETVFLRIEPGSLNQSKIKKLKLEEVQKDSLLCGQASPKATRILDITKKEEDILAQMKPKTRYNIRLAEKRGVKVRIIDNEDILYDLLMATSQKGGGYFPHEKSYYKKLIRELSKDQLVHVFVAEHEGDYLAAILVTFFKETAIYLYGGQSSIKKNLMAPYLCQWEAIKYAKQKGLSYYDFWGVAETDDKKDPWFGISRFKEGFGGEKVVFPGSYDYVLSNFWYNGLTTLAKMRRIFKK